ncbi:MAG: hypothetical protein U0166_22125 [Acidobacteriota bacterium]
MARRRTFLRSASRALALGAIPWPAPLLAAPPPAASAPRYFTAKELAILGEVAREVLPAKDVLSGTVDVAANLDGYLARFPRYDLGLIRKGLRMLNAEVTYILARALGQATALDRTSVSKYLVTLGYYGDGNGEADLPAASRRIWPRMGYPGPRGKDFAGFSPSQGPLPEASLDDRLGGADPLAFLEKRELLA